MLIDSDLLISSLRLATPIALIALGVTFSERGGVINIGVEGITMAAVLAAAIAAHFTGSPWIALACSVATGCLFGALHGLWCVYFRADHIISGTAINILTLSTALFLTRLIWGWRGTSAAVPTLNAWIIVLIMIFLIIGGHIYLFYTPWGLRLRVVGEHPQAADTSGIDVHRTRVLYSILCGGLCGLSGAFLLNDLGRFSIGMVGGRGFIGIASMVVGNYSPIPAFCASWFFGFVDALQMRLQGVIPSQFSFMMPYVLTVIVLAGFIGRSRVPKSDGKHYIKE